MKYNRQSKILELIENCPVETQEELCDRLRELDFNVTQATVSRDIKELKIIKVTDESGRSKYAAAPGDINLMSDKMLAVFAHAFLSVDYANNIVVIKTLPGMAQAVASTVDSLKNTGILGSIGGDDTVMVVCRTEKYAESLVENILRLTNNKRKV